MTPLIAGLLLLVASLAKTVEPKGATLTLGSQSRTVKRASLGIKVKPEHFDQAAGRLVYRPDPAHTTYWLSVEVDEEAGEDATPLPLVEDIPVRRAAGGQHPSLQALGALAVREAGDGKDCDEWGAWIGHELPTLCRNQVRFQGWDGGSLRVRWDARYEEGGRARDFVFEGPVEFTGIYMLVKQSEHAEEFLGGSWGGQSAQTLDKHALGPVDLGPALRTFDKLLGREEKPVPPEDRNWVPVVFMPKGIPLSEHWASEAKLPPPPATRSEGRVTDGRQAFSLELPAEWESVEDVILAGLGGLSLRRAGPPEATLKAVAVEHPFKMTLEDYIENSTRAYARIWKVDERTSLPLGGAPAVRMVILQEIGPNVTRQLKYYVATKKGAIVITFGTTPEAFAASLDGFEAVARSLKLAD